MKVYSLTATDWAIESESSADKAYKVHLETDALGSEHYVCDCIAYVIDRNRKRKVTPGAYGACKHLVAVTQFRIRSADEDMESLQERFQALKESLSDG